MLLVAFSSRTYPLLSSWANVCSDYPNQGPKALLLLLVLTFITLFFSLFFGCQLLLLLLLSIFLRRLRSDWFRGPGLVCRLYEDLSISPLFCDFLGIRFMVSSFQSRP